MSVFQLMSPYVIKTPTNWFYHLYVTFVAAGHFVTFPYKCSAPITMFPAICWFWIGTFSKPYLYATDCFGADTPGNPLTPTTIDKQCFKNKPLRNNFKTLKLVFAIHPHKLHCSSPMLPRIRSHHQQSSYQRLTWLKSQICYKMKNCPRILQIACIYIADSFNIFSVSNKNTEWKKLYKI